MKPKSNLLQASLWPGVLWMVCLVFPGLAQRSAPATANCPAAERAEAIQWSQLGGRAGENYKGDGLVVSPTATGSGNAAGVRLRCLFQRLEAQATADGLWLVSTTANESCLTFDSREPQTEESTNERFRVVATAVKRQNPVVNWAEELSRTGTVEVVDQLVRFIRPGLVEEYSVSMDGVRQDFLIQERPRAEGELRLELAASGVKLEPSACGAQLAVGKSARRIAYARLKVTDAKGRELPARMEPFSLPDGPTTLVSQPAIKSAQMLAILVDDADADYPVRIDPTFSDANWISLGGINGAISEIYAAAVDGSGNLYIGGSFTLVGDVIANHIAKWDGTSWSALGSGMNGLGTPYVYALAVSGGDLYVGGSFTTAGGIVANRIAKWDGNNWSTLGPGTGLNGDVRALAVLGNDLYAGGSFTSADGKAANRIAKWDGSSWTVLGPGMNSDVLALAVTGTDLYAGGSFTTAGGSGANFIAKWDGNNWSALDSGLGSFRSSVYALAVSGSDLFVGGSFTTAGGSLAHCIAKWNGSVWSSLGSGMNAEVLALAVSGTDVYAGGGFTNAGGVAANCVAKWNGSTWSALSSGTAGGSFFGTYVSALALSGSDVYAGGDFTSAGGSPANHIAKWDGNAWSALGWGMSPYVLYPYVHTLAVSDHDLYAAGGFSIAGTNVARCIARWNGTNWSALGSGLNMTAYALAMSGDDVFAGGRFTKAGGSTVNYIAKWNGSAWSALDSGMDSDVLALAASGSDLYAAGYFYIAGGNAVNRIAKWDGNSWSGLASGINSGGYAFALAVSSGNLYVGGTFTTATNTGGVPVVVNRIAQWDGNAWSALGSGMNGTVQALAVAGSLVYAGGSFTNAGGSAANNIAKWDGNAWSALGSGLNGTVYALAVTGTELYAGGDFTTAGGSTARSIARWNGTAWSACGSGMNNRVHALVVSGNDLYAGGEFTTAGGKVSAFVAKWAPLAFRANRVTVSNGTFHALLTGPDTNTVIVDCTDSFFNWIPVATNTLPPGGAWPLSLPIGTNHHQLYRAHLVP